MNKTILTLALLAGAPFTAQPQGAMKSDPTMKVAGSGKLPAGWQLRFDDGRAGRPKPKMTDVNFVTMGGGYHVTSGPAAIYFRPKDSARGAFTVEASFAQTKPSGHEAYGLFIGGSHLKNPKQQYLYFLVRPMDGNFYVAHRAASEVHKIAPWMAHAAVSKQDDTGKAANVLTVQVTIDSVHFSANGQRVKSLAKSEMHGFDTDGQTGLRINHNLDVHVGSFEVKK